MLNYRHQASIFGQKAVWNNTIIYKSSIRLLIYFGKLLVTGVIVAELDFESPSSAVPDRSREISLTSSSSGELRPELMTEFELELMVDSLID